MRARTAAQLSNQQEQKDVSRKESFVEGFLEVRWEESTEFKGSILLIFDLRFIELHGGI